jgi:hypothetical protein
MKETYWLKRIFKNDTEDDTTDTVSVTAESELEAKEQVTRGLKNVTVENLGKPNLIKGSNQGKNLQLLPSGSKSVPPWRDGYRYGSDF